MEMPNEMKRSSNQVFARVIVSVTTLIIALTITQIFVERSWQIQIPVGTHDSAFLGTGFYTKEVSIDNVPFRWTNGSAIVNVPWLRTGYLVAIRANIGPGVSYDFELRDRER
jgi:hypothetical protein